jgi:hypothetical protein
MHGRCYARDAHARKARAREARGRERAAPNSAERAAATAPTDSAGVSAASAALEPWLEPPRAAAEPAMRESDGTRCMAADWLGVRE